MRPPAQVQRALHDASFNLLRENLSEIEPPHRDVIHRYGLYSRLDITKSTIAVVRSKIGAD